MSKELDKIKNVHDDSQVIGEFLEWMRHEGYFICTEREKKVHDVYLPVSKSIEQWLAEYFDIDLDKAEEERMELLEEFRKKALEQ